MGLFSKKKKRLFKIVTQGGDIIWVDTPKKAREVVKIIAGVIFEVKK